MQKIIPDIGNNFWVQSLATKYKQMDGVPVVIADVRFGNELDVIHSLGGVVVKVVRPSLNNGDCHASEKTIDELNGDYEIINDGSLEELYSKISDVFKKLQI